VILSYKDKRTEDFALGKRVKEFQSFARQAEKRLEILDAAPDKRALMMLPSNHFEALGGERRDNTASALTSNGGSVSSGRMRLLARPMWKSLIIIREEEILWHEHRFTPARFSPTN
jgi:plasmid maintenance system killer protein